MARTVWVLGAGFSIPLGGPSFRRLISESTRVMASEVLSEDQRSWASVVERVYEAGLVGKQRTPENAGVELWRDAEEFIELVDIAVNNPSSLQASIIAGSVGRRLPPPRTSLSVATRPPEGIREILKELHGEAVRFCAAACISFLSVAERDPDVALETERWEPYVRWKRELLVPGDSIITFNWDRVLDILRAAKEGVGLASFVPGGELVDQGGVPVYHLHGHMAWQREQKDPSKIYVHQDTHAAVGNPQLAVLGTPGAMKKETCQTILLSLWAVAMAALESAEKVIFLGYRFPPSDNMSKVALLGALKRSKTTRMHVVLGPRSEDAARLTGLLGWTHPEQGPERQILLHDMGAEDFLAVVDRRHL